MTQVYVAMSGGVDSTAAALLLLQKGYQVTGVTLRLHNTDPENSELLDAKAAANKLGIPHHVLDLQKQFRTEVMDRFVSEYIQGRTPNPCIDCNRYIKFGALLDWALEQGADFLATGHYARTSFDPSTGRYLLLRGQDSRKDQSYVLCRLNQKQLKHLILPVGDYKKSDLRAMAQTQGLANAQKPDSQDICFIPDGDYGAFLQRDGVKLTEGNFVDTQGKILGRHKGLECYTTGQRKGLGISASTRLYVLRKDLERHEIVLGSNRDLYTQELIADDLNFISIPELTGPMAVTVKTRYSQQEASAILEPLADRKVRAVFDEPQRAITAGQTAAFYNLDHKEIIVGGGTICS